MLTKKDVQDQAATFLAPISSDAPSGKTPNQDPRYEALRTAMTALDSPTGGQVDWAQVAKQGGEILRSVAKDLLAASYTTFALIQTQQFRGMAIGVAILQGLFDEHWDGMFPPAQRLRARGNALDWLIGRVEAAIPTLPVSPSDRGTVDLVVEAWKALSTSARDKLGEHCPPMRGVGDALQRLQLKLPAAESTTAPATTVASPSPSDVAPSAAPAPAPPPSASAPASPSLAAASPASPAPAATLPEQDPLELLKTQAKPWLAPIPGNQRAGIDPRYDLAYEAARVEVTKLESPTAPPPEWPVVRQKSEVVLKEKGKDLLMASYWAFARFKDQGLTALPLGLVVLAELLDQFAEDVFPTRARGRSNAVGWLITALESGLAEVKLEAKDRAAVLQLEVAAKYLAMTIRSRMEDPPGTSPLTDRVTRMRLAVPEPKPTPPPAPPAATPEAARTTPVASQPSTPAASAVTAPMPTVSASISNPEEVNKFLQETGKALVKAANLLRQADTSNPTSYRLLRQGIWIHLAGAPPSDAGGKTQLPAVPAPRLTQLQTIAANQKWAALLEETESALTQFRFALDLQWMSWNALNGLGATHASARDTVAMEVQSLLKRMPTLPDLVAVSGTPLASPDTREWLKTHVLATTGGNAPATASDDPGEAMGQVVALIKEKKAREAMELAKQSISDAGPRQRIVRRLTLAEAILASGDAILARGMFAAVDRDLTERGLLEWETALAGRCLDGLVRAIRAANQGSNRFGGLEHAFERLCLVDPVAAARLSG